MGKSPYILDSTTCSSTKAYELLSEKKWTEAKDELLNSFDGHDPVIANYIGYVFDQQDTEFYDADIAYKYYLIAASAGNIYALHAVAGILLARGDRQRALDAYKKCSAAGDSNCSYLLYRLLKEAKDINAVDFLKTAADQGHPVAIQKLSTLYIRGRFGLKYFMIGVKMYFKNIPDLIRFTKQNVV